MILQKSFKYADLVLRKHFLLLRTWKMLYLFNIFCGNSDRLFFLIRAFDVEIFCNTVNVFTVTFDQFQVIKKITV